MIIEYHRPQTINEALILLSRDQPATVPLSGGTVLNQPSREAYAVVDLQSLGLDEINKHGQLLQIGATCKLQSLLELDGKSDVVLPQALCDAIRLEGTINIRQLATVAGGLVSADGRSPFGTAMLALNPTLTLLPGEEEISYGELLPLRDLNLRHRLIAQIYLPLNTKLSYHYVSRSPFDLPLVSAAVAIWSSGRTRVVLGGYGEMPALAFDGPESSGAEIAAQNVFQNAGDQWASAQYRREMAVVLTKRAIADIGGRV